MTSRWSTLVFGAGTVFLAPTTFALAQQAAQPAPSSTQLPPVEVIQKQPAPAKKAVQKAAPKKKVVAVPQPPPPAPEPVETAPANPNPVYGAAGSGGAAARAEQSAQTPVNPAALIPANLEGFASSATNVNPEQLTERQPRTTNELFTRVPGVIVINDDGNAHHGGIGIRGSSPRRTRKVLFMEDGHALNLALWLDPSVHGIPPLDRIESVEVLRGTVITHGPNNNFGVVNLRNLSPFGPNETVVSGALGFTESDGPDFYGISNRRHVHTRQSIGNVGVVASYSGSDVDGSWNTERLRFNDFYSAIGWKSINQDLVVSFSYGRQRDNYDESNLEGEDNDPPGQVESNFFQFGHDKTRFAPGAIFNNYNGDIYRAQATHNLYVDDDTTVTTKLYAQRHRRDRYQIVTLEDNPADADDPGLAPVADGDDVFLPEDSMFGRLRTFRHIGGEVRTELANRPFFGGITQDIQFGLRYEYQDLKNRNFLGLSGQVLKDGDTQGLTIFERNLEADTFSAFVQTALHVTRDFTVVPGARFEWYRVKRNSLVTAREESEAEEVEDPAPNDCELIQVGLDECLEIEGIDRTPFTQKYDTGSILPGVSLAYSGFRRTTIYGGYNRGLSTAVLRNEDFPAPDEIGDNFQIGIRSTAVRGLTFDVAAFHNRLKDFQYGDSFSSAGDRSFGRADEVEINGVELYGRLDSNPFTGGAWNLFGEANYTYARSIIEEGTTVIEDDMGNEITVSLAGNQVPEVPFHVAALTAGIEHRPSNGWHWDVSATYTYRGAFFTDELNTAFGSDPEGENGEVPEVWLLSARANLKLGNSGASVWVSGDNLLDELYISDREDGLKPGIGRTIWTGFKYKF